MISVGFWGKPFSFTVIQVYAPTSNAEEAEVLWGPKRPSRTNTQKRCPFHYRGLECKSRKSRNTWSTGKFGLGVQNEAEKRLIEFCQENTLVIANTLFQQQHKRRLYTWTSPDGQHWNQIDYIPWSWLWLRSWTTYCQNGILVSHKKDHIWVSSNEVDEPRIYYREWSKSESER